MPEKDAAKDDNFVAAKKRVTDKALPLDFVSGVGSRNDALTIYLTRALQPHELQTLKKITADEAPGQPVEYVTAGEFKPR